MCRPNIFLLLSWKRSWWNTRMAQLSFFDSQLKSKRVILKHFDSRDVSRAFPEPGIPNSAGSFGAAVMPSEALMIWSSLIWSFKLFYCDKVLWQSYSNNMIEWYNSYRPIFFRVSFDMFWCIMGKLSLGEHTHESNLLAN